MVFHKNRLLADDSHVISYLVFSKIWKVVLNVSSVVVAFGALRVKADCKGLVFFSR